MEGLASIHYHLLAGNFCRLHIPMNMTTHSDPKRPPDPGNPGSL